MKSVHAAVFGRVQGVGFRAWTAEVAMARGLVGWVRNRRDSSVEAVFSGPEAEVEAMLAALHQGPPGARVDGVETRPHAEAETVTSFEVRPTG